MKCMCIRMYVCMYVCMYVDSISVRESPTKVLVMLIGDAFLSLGCASLFSLHLTLFPFCCLLHFYKQFLILLL